MKIAMTTRALALYGAVALLAGCTSAGGSGPIVPPGTTHYMYVTNSDSILAFPLTATGNVAPALTLAGGTNFNNIFQMAIDSTGRITVPNAADTGMLTYAAGASGAATPVATLSGAATTFGNAQAVGVDASGKLFVGDLHDDTIKIFAANANGNVAPTATIAGALTGITGPGGEQFDAAGKLYDTEFLHLLVFAAGATGNVAPLQNLSYSDDANNVAIDATGKIIVPQCQDHEVLTFAAGATGSAAPTGTLAGAATGLLCPIGVALDPAGNLWVVQDAALGTSPGSILKFAPGATGNTAPIATISGAATTFTSASDIVYF